MCFEAGRPCAVSCLTNRVSFRHERCVLHKRCSSYQDFIKETLSLFCTRTEEEVGQAVKDSGVKREDIFLVTKLADEGHGYEECLKAFDVSRKK